LNVLERVKHQKIVVASDDVGSMAAHREFEELVVPRVTTHCYSGVDFNPFCLACYGREQSSDIILVYVSTESLPAQDFREFSEQSKRDENFSLLEREIESLARF
jgi:hypothetical protein